MLNFRAVAQLGSALDWGSRGRRFKSCQPDQKKEPLKHWEFLEFGRFFVALCNKGPCAR